MSSEESNSQGSSHSDGRSATFYCDFHAGDLGHTVLVGSTRQGKCVQGFTAIATNNEVLTISGSSGEVNAVAKPNDARSETQRLARNHAVFAARKKGQTLQQIADTHGITKERVRQILIGGTLSQLPGTERLSPITRGLLIRLGYRRAAAVHTALKKGTLHDGCTFGMGTKRFSEIEAWAQERDSRLGRATTTRRPTATP